MGRRKRYLELPHPEPQVTVCGEWPWAPLASLPAGGAVAFGGPTPRCPMVLVGR